jgi:hypothetical protein
MRNASVAISQRESITEAHPTHSYMQGRLYPRLRSFAITILLGVRSGKTGVTLSAGEPGHGCQFLSNVTTSGSAAVPLPKTYAFPQAFFRPRQDSLVWRACRCQGLRSNPKGLALTAAGSELHSLRKRPERTPDGTGERSEQRPFLCFGFCPRVG